MNSRTLVEKTLQFDNPERIPRHLWTLPWAEDHHPDALTLLHTTYPNDIVTAPAEYQIPPQRSGEEYRPGIYIDEWGCKFHNVHEGVIGIVEEPLISPSWEELDTFYPPEEMLSLNTDAVNAFCRSTGKFVSGCCGPRPFERLQFIRTTDQAFMDLADNTSELHELLHRIHEHYCKELEMWAKTDVDAVFFMDDWGSQHGLLISPAHFRQIFKPMYQDYVDIANHYGKYIFMHSDGNIIDIYPDLIEIGVDAVNSQIFCMDMQTLSEKYAGQITFWGEIDRQGLLPHGSRQDIVDAVHNVYGLLYQDGGVIAQCEFGPGARPENVLKVFETWDSIRGER